MENNSDQRKFPFSSLKTIFASLNEHYCEGNHQHAYSKNIGVINPPFAGILMKLCHLAK